MTPLLDDQVLSNIGKSEPPQKQLATRRDIRKYAVATGQRLRKFLDGDEAPPLFHIALFWDIVPLDELLPDGLSVDPLLPEFPLKRAMAGGWNIQYYRPIYPGDELAAQRTLSNIYEKSGSKGPLIFYEITRDIRTSAGEPVLTEKMTRILR
jgi:hydroxyacyl-ACP dehydratase HTD2-like protein with hotdog domain